MDSKPLRTAPDAGQLISAGKDAILRNWEKQILKHLPAARQQKKAALRDHVPNLLDDLATTCRAGHITEPQATGETALKHGRQRSFAGVYTLDQVLTEFQLLRRAIFDVIEVQGPVDRRSRDLILEYLELVISESATEYVRIQFTQEQEARAAVETSARRLRGLHTVTEAALSSNVSLDRLLTDLSERVRELFAADNAAILLIDPTGQHLEVRAASGLESEVEKQPKVPVGQGMAGSIFASLKSRIINDMSKAIVINEILRRSVKSALASPLRLVNKAIGVVHVDMVESHEFTQDDLTLLELIADRIAVVIEHTSLIERQRDSEARLRLINEATPQILWTADPNGEFSDFNENWYGYTGLPHLSTASLTSRNSQWLEAVHIDDRPRFSEAWKKAQASGAFYLEHRLRNGKGEYRWFLTRAAPVCDSVGIITEWVGSSTDIEEQKHYQNLLEQEREQREQFVNTLTHDLRNPLAAAHTSAKLISLHPAALDRIPTWSARIMDSITRADRMIQDLLDVSHVRTGKPLPLSLEVCDLREIAQACADELNTVHGNTIRIDGPHQIVGHWSKGELRRALDNLMSNAVKYGLPRSPITVSLEDLGNQARIKIHNLGDPIPESERAMIFEPFARAGAAKASGKKGWGLGLLLVAAVAKAHGGSVLVESDRENGTTFTMTLPK